MSFDASGLNPRVPANAAAAWSAGLDGRSGIYHGPERRAAVGARTWLAATLDEIDYGMLLVADETRVVHVNHAARHELDGLHPLEVHGTELRVRDPRDHVTLAGALQAAARRGLRRLLTLATGVARASISVVPLNVPSAGGPMTLIMLGRREVCATLSVEGYARCHGLTPAETRVLAALCQGLPPNRIARQFGVGIATVRTQINNIRAKTGAQSIFALVQQVAMLPPLMSVLRGASNVGGWPTPQRCDALAA
ncbi:MAG: helix-turn-helix transcriptional regulator [Proteobacteria bacterium]|nr:helix-turn-helix transcriptional regulator [Pseudomonadota bacterium]